MSLSRLLRNTVCIAIFCAFGILSRPTTGWGQNGYSLEANRVVIDSKEQWEQWQYASKTIQITEEGVKPTFFRKSTTIEVDGREESVTGVNAALNAIELGGGALGAGSNSGGVTNVMDGDLNTYWEPDLSDPLQDWWMQIDLGRTVAATKIVLKFVEEDLGDPFLQFKVTTSQGEKTVGPPIYRTRYTTKQPNKTLRVVEVDLTKQLPTKWPTATGDFKGDVINFVGVGITDSDFGKARQVSQADYENLSADLQGDVDYYRRDSAGNERLLRGGKDAWDALQGSEKQGNVLYHKREIPRLAEIEVWGIGDNVGIGVIDRGGKVNSVDNNGAEPAVVDGDYFGEVLYWPAVGGYNPNLIPPSSPTDIERQLFVDLGGMFFLDNIRILQMNAWSSWTSPFPEYRLLLSDGSTNAGGKLAWTIVGAAKKLNVSRYSTSERYNNFEFPLTKAKYFAFMYRMWPNDGSAEFRADSFALSEIQFFGEGYMPKTLLSSVFEGSEPFIELGRTPQNLSSIEWEADLDLGSSLILQTRTGNTVVTQTHYYKKNGEAYPGTEEEAAEAHASDKEFFGANSVGPIVAQSVPGSDWSGWSQPYVVSGQQISSPSPRKYVAVRAVLETEDPNAAATLRSVQLNFVNPVAGTIVGEVLPARLEDIGRTQNLSYFVRSTFESSSRGFDEILIKAPDGVDMTLQQVNVSVTGKEDAMYTSGSSGFEVVMNESDSLWVRLPEPIKNTNGSALIELQFSATIFGYNTFFIGSIRHSEFEDSWQRVDDGDANGVSDSETTVILALERGSLLGDIQADAVFSPNGDGINDKLEVNFSLMRVGVSAPVKVEIYDLSGRSVNRLSDEAIDAGRHSVSWTGADRSGVTVSPGIYVLRIDLEVDSKSSKNTSVSRLVHVVY